LKFNIQVLNFISCVNFYRSRATDCPEDQQ